MADEAKKHISYVFRSDQFRPIFKSSSGAKKNKNWQRIYKKGGFLAVAFNCQSQMKFATVVHFETSMSPKCRIIGKSELKKIWHVESGIWDLGFGI